MGERSTRRAGGLFPCGQHYPPVLNRVYRVGAKIYNYLSTWYTIGAYHHFFSCTAPLAAGRRLLPTMTVAAADPRYRCSAHRQHGCRRTTRTRYIAPRRLAPLAALGVVGAYLAGTLPPAAALIFNPHHILADAELRDAASLSATAIQRFLEQKGSALTAFRETVEGETLSAAEIFQRVATRTGISPKFLLAVVEREKGLLRKTASAVKPSDLDWATGYSCFAGRCKDQYRGFFNQVDSTAITQNIYAERAATFPFQVGKSATTRDGFVVVPENQATASLYIYTPYVGQSPELGITSGQGGNRLLHNIWQQFFTDAKYPEGLVLTDGSVFWKIEQGRKRQFATADLFLADYPADDAISVTPKILAAYPDGPDINFANHTVVRSAATGQALLLHDGRQRPIMDEDALAKLHDVRLAVSTFGEIPLVAAERLEPYPLGAPITTASIYPQGKLFQDESGALSWVQDRLRRPVDAAVARINYRNRPPEITTAAVLEPYPLGSPVLIADGHVVKNPAGNYYLITNGERRKITSEKLAVALFGTERVAAAVTVSDDVLALSDAGLNIDYIDDTIPDPPAATPAPAAAPAAITPHYAVESLAVTPPALAGLIGQTITVEATLVNAGNTAWQGSDVTLSLNSSPPLRFAETLVPVGATATFRGPLTFTAQPGLQPQTFTMLGPDGLPIARLAKFALLKPAVSANVASHTLPVAIKNSWRPQPVVIRIKNVSADQTWTSAKTALRLTGPQGNTSPFYDPADWLKPDVPAVPSKAKTVKPGATGEFRFTLRPRGVKPGVYELHFNLELRDAQKSVLINGREEWVMKVRVDK